MAWQEEGDGWRGYVFSRHRRGRPVRIIGRTRLYPFPEDAQKAARRLEKTKR